MAWMQDNPLEVPSQRETYRRRIGTGRSRPGWSRRNEKDLIRPQRARSGARAPFIDRSTGKALSVRLSVHTARLPPPPKKAKWSSANNATLVMTLQAEQDRENQADNSWKASVWTTCEKALAGSEVLSGGAPKKAKGCQDHWGKVCSLSKLSVSNVLILYLSCGRIA
ncbi:hypothetical protein DXG03_006596 [Asterophora parasitica]|uniref:Uncharacterized protein n=1 Tax=Asterophora parasitica TaxID=117018 RepID=A0A9P7G144_9AGAR|nr:hypothetical protein DXG03_006596 [Asterophora parasitica]